MKKRMICVLMTAVLSIAFVIGCGKNEETGVTDSKIDEINVAEMDEIAPNSSEEQTSGDSLESEEIFADLNEEMSAIEAESLEIQNELQDATTQSDMNILSAQDYQLWDDELNSLWSRFMEVASEDFKATVQDEQKNWIKEKEEKIELAGAQFEGGSMQPFIENTKASELTRIRCYEIAGYLAEATGQSLDLEVPTLLVLDFVDRQGTMDTVYSELTVEEAEENRYPTTISIYRLTTFDGNSVLQSDGVYEFEDETLGVRGIIRVIDGGSGAIFEITESDWDLVNVGDVFEFPEVR
ncbi:MAG: lysozyme inhibitor LprI family protein [Roseburia sp.]